MRMWATQSRYRLLKASEATVWMCGVADMTATRHGKSRSETGSTSSTRWRLSACFGGTRRDRQRLRDRHASQLPHPRVQKVWGHMLRPTESAHTCAAMLSSFEDGGN